MCKFAVGESSSKPKRQCVPSGIGSASRPNDLPLIRRRVSIERRDGREGQSHTGRRERNGGGATGPWDR